MGKLVLRDGRVLELTSEQSERLGMVILLSADFAKGVRVNGEYFKLNDIVTDPEEVLRVTQQQMFDVPTVRVARKSGKTKELA